MPIAVNLQRKQVLHEPFCQIYGNRFENIFHALMECKAAQKTWRLTNFAERFKSLAGPYMLTVFQDLAKKISRTNFELMAITCWTIWKARNKYIFEAKKLNPHMSMAKAEALLEAYQRIRPSGQIHRADKEENKTKIQKPPLQK